MDLAKFSNSVNNKKTSKKDYNTVRGEPYDIKNPNSGNQNVHCTEDLRTTWNIKKDKHIPRSPTGPHHALYMKTQPNSVNQSETVHFCHNDVQMSQLDYQDQSEMLTHTAETACVRKTTTNYQSESMNRHSTENQYMNKTTNTTDNTTARSQLKQNKELSTQDEGHHLKNTRFKCSSQVRNKLQTAVSIILKQKVDSQTSEQPKLTFADIVRNHPPNKVTVRAPICPPVVNQNRRYKSDKQSPVNKLQIQQPRERQRQIKATMMLSSAKKNQNSYVQKHIGSEILRKQ
jgi:hypothetical protein